MEKLNLFDLKKVLGFLETDGRALDRELVNFHIFEKNNASKVIEELVKYQNSDGGFGNCLEADVRSPISSALASSIALNVFVNIEAQAALPEVKNLIEYFVKTLDREKLRWPIVPQEVYKYPHAPWWVSEDIIESFRGCYANPRAEIVSGLLYYKEQFPSALLEEIIFSIQNYILNESNDITMHDLICYISLLDSNRLPDDMVSSVSERLKNCVLEITEVNSEKWSNYSAKPLWMAPTPRSFSYKFLEKPVEENLNYEIKSFKEKGIWEPNWDWGDHFSEEWPKAKKEWTSYLILKNLKFFKAYGRININ